MAYDPRQMINSPEWRAADPFYGGQQNINRLPMPTPRSDMTPAPVDAGQQAAAADSVGESERPADLQPGNRKSIREYLAEIRQLRSQMRAQGVPEDQLPVPTFTNVQYGPLDKPQGMIETGPGGMGEREVRSYMVPEYQEVPGTFGQVERGSAHPITQAQAGIEKVKSVTNPIDPRRPDAVAFELIDEAMEAYRQQNGSWPTPEQAQQMLYSIRNQAFEEQGKLISRLKKDYKDADVQALWNAYESGNWGYAADASQNMLSNKRVGAVADEAAKAWNKAEESNMRPLNPETGEYFTSLNEYTEFKVTEYTDMVKGLLQTMHEMNSSEKGAGTKKKGEAQSKPSYNPEATPSPSYTPSLPDAARSQLRQGVITTFGNGQKWTIDQNGQPKRVE
jgi:hypothetical protein